MGTMDKMEKFIQSTNKVSHVGVFSGQIFVQGFEIAQETWPPKTPLAKSVAMLATMSFFSYMKTSTRESLGRSVNPN